MLIPAFITFILMGLLFPVLFVYTLWFMYKGLTTPGSPKKNNKKKSQNPKEIPAPERIAVLTCTNCNQPMHINTKHQVCSHCSTPYTLPAEYLDIFKYREAASEKLEQAERFWKKARFYGSGFMRWFLLFLLLWLPICMGVIIFRSEDADIVDRWLHDYGAFGRGLVSFSFIAFFFWMFILFITRGLLGEKTRKLIPDLDVAHMDRQPENADCMTCGAALEIKANAVGCMCMYCGTENYRKQFTWKLREDAKHKHLQTQASLVEAIDAYKTALDDAMGTPAVLMFILVVLPLFLFVIPYLLWNWITTHVLGSVLLALFGILLFYLIQKWRNKKVQKVKL
jgi:predicted RNA-binding Zn-ribbon protein involved in translation (DUF1610 family)